LKRWVSPVEFSDAASNVWRDVVKDEVSLAKREFEGCEDFIILSPLIRKLPKKYREVVFLRFFAGMSLEEISGELGRPVGTVKAQLHRALKRLRGDLQPSGTAEHSISTDSDLALLATGLREEVD
jgi:DNA-directed RNA polymerase specialized sigma24 family protein